MAALRKASAYSRRKVRPYTRKSKSKSKSYIKVVPQNKIVKYHMGEVRAFNDGKFKNHLRLISTEKVQIRDNALESCRQLINKVLDKDALGKYYFGVMVYPHHILRNNKTAAGAGADRLSSGMKHSFGVSEGRAAIVVPGKEVFLISVEGENELKVAREALRMVKSKLPCRSKITFEKTL